MIKTVSFTNFKGFRNLAIDLEPLTAIVGPNASGKTSILQGLHLLAELRSRRPEHVFSGKFSPSRIYRRGSSGEMALSLTSTASIAIKVIASKKNASIDQWVIGLSWKEDPTKDSWVKEGKPLGDRSPLTSAALLSLDAARMAAADYSAEAKPKMNAQGRGLASVLAFIALNKPDDFATIQQRLRCVIPTVERVRFDRVAASRKEVTSVGSPGTGGTLQKVITEVILLDMKGALGVPAESVSEGTLIVLGLLTAMMAPERPELILLDDLDHGLHPRAQKELVALLRRFLKENPKCQIIFTTHSPYLLDNLRPEEVRLTTLNDDGSASCASLVEHPDFDRWKDEMTPGEMWTLFGEQWAASHSA